MADEKKANEEKPKEAKAEKAPAKPQPAEGGGGGGDAKEKRIKIGKMDLAQVEEALKNVQATMGGFDSAYAQSLLGRKKILTQGGTPQGPSRKAA